jgi:hypothetical protein
MPNIFSKPTEEATLGVAINCCYGGFSLSVKAVEELRKRIGEPEIQSYSFESYNDKYTRHHPVLIEVIKELGEEANGPFAKIEIDYIEEKYKDHYSVKEYDGMEGVSIRYHKYQMDKIKEILKSDVDNDEKVRKITEVL